MSTVNETKIKVIVELHAKPGKRVIGCAIQGDSHQAVALTNGGKIIIKNLIARTEKHFIHYISL